MSRHLTALLEALAEDELRKTVGFSPDIVDTNRVLNYPFSNDAQRADALEDWLQGNQPCIFGRMAAKYHGIDFCFITDAELYKPDEDVREKIQQHRLLWKRRAYERRRTHGFMLVICSNRVLHARPDSNLRAFASYIQDLAGWPTHDDPEGNYIADEWLFLRDAPGDGVRKFNFSVDFFAAAGHGRWWHDHRVPGGIAFTANSLGHMAALREESGGTGSPIEWSLRVAMLTISSAEEKASHGPATWLLDQNGRPIRPFKWTQADPIPELSKFPNKDHGSYAGYHHTDHAIREEFFDGNDVPARKRKPYLMDFKYIFDSEAPDNAPLMQGLPSSRAEAEAELGNPDTWRAVATTETMRRPPRVPRFAQAEIKAALQACSAWRMSDANLERLFEVRSTRAD